MPNGEWKSVKYLFVDLYGTLTAGDSHAIVDICNRVVLNHKLSIAPEEIQDQWGKRIWHEISVSSGSSFRSLMELEDVSLRATLSELGYTIDVRSYINSLETHWRKPHFYPDVKDFVKNIRLPVCIVSNADRSNAEEVMKTLDANFELVTSEDCQCYKPDPAIFQYALDKTGWPVANTLHIGDSLHGDIEPARKVGLQTALVRRSHGLSDPGSCIPDFEIRSMTDVLDSLQSQ